MSEMHITHAAHYSSMSDICILCVIIGIFEQTMTCSISACQQMKIQLMMVLVMPV